MFIIFILILLAVLVGIMSAIYSIFAPFMQNIGNVVYFNSAYYGALAGVERAQLILKYKQPGFEGSGGFFGGNNFGPQSDKITEDFGLITSQNNGFIWEISSRTRNIPKPGEGNIDYLLSNGTDSINYNKLPYFTSEKINLSLDNTTNPNYYYTGISTISYFSGGYFTGIIRLPPKAKENFNSPLCYTTSNCDSSGDGIPDDIIINWIFEGLYNGVPFSIIPTISVFYYGGGFVDENKDIAIRESIINETGNIYFGDYVQKHNPLIDRISNILDEHNVISLEENIIKNKTFRELLETNTSDIKLSLGIVNLIYTQNQNIYPFLEYQFSFPQYVADNFFTIQGAGIVGDYNVKIFIKKSTNEQSSIGDFTIIF